SVQDRGMHTSRMLWTT
nr:immunoglobulin heavy chain junction region [Mus musculus]